MAQRVSIADLPGRAVAKLFEGAEHGSPVSVFVSSHEPGDGPQLHRHPYAETFVMLEGHARFEADGESVEAGPGEIVIVPAGAAHRFENSGDVPLRQVSVHPSERVIQEDL